MLQLFIPIYNYYMGQFTSSLLIIIMFINSQPFVLVLIDVVDRSV